jgi:squalene-hopene/tetraprenyl-beta-curcumene cyclase
MMNPATVAFSGESLYGVGHHFFCRRKSNRKKPQSRSFLNDGGYYYVIPTENADPSTSERYDANGGLRSYGSMTYAGFKSSVYAGLTKDDPRAKAALEWISKNYSVKQNPGQGSAGLYYYYNTFGSALSASGLEKISTNNEGDRDWRQDLLAELARTQQPDGSWVNANRQWFENDPKLCTAFALLALSYCDDTSADSRQQPE